MTGPFPPAAERPRPIIGASWKMHLTASEAAAYLETFRPLVAAIADRDFVILPSFPAIPTARDSLTGSNIAWGAQDVHPEDDGPHTGDVSAPMLADLGCRFVEVGHSERRRDHGESAMLIGRKVGAVLRWGMTPILCVGDEARRGPRAALESIVPDLAISLAEFDRASLMGLVIAYEPAWAIGEGAASADPSEVAAVHTGVRAWLASVGLGDARIRLIYGGSVDLKMADIMLGTEEVDGLFVGRSSLDPRAFAAVAAVPIRHERR